ncbi:MAG TPA: carbohydrate ABC transporter permease [Clostridiaceae bacterium]|nr:carbohydrate ABC transporter permease [Clostridiaceae bacterium]
MKRKRLKMVFFEILAVILSLVIVFPLLLIVINSFKSYGEANRLNLSLNNINFKDILYNYREVLESGGLITGYKNSIIVTTLSVFLIIIFSSTAAFIINRRKQKLTKIINMFIIIGMTLPMSIVPTYFVVKSMGLSKSYLGISLVYLAASFSFSVFLYTGYYRSIPVDIDESAIMEGCGLYRMFFQIIFPLVKPVTATVVITNVMSIWNDFTVALFLLNSPKRFTAVLTTFAFFGQQASRWNLLFADVVLISLPVVLLYLLLQRDIVSGMTAGSIKG